MNSNELAAQLQFFKDIGVDSLYVEPNLVVPRDREVAPLKQAPSEVTHVAPVSAPSMTLETIRAEIGDCQRCKLAPKRTNIVFGSGNAAAELVFVGEAPGYDEDQQGLPFVGRAGQLLT